MAATLNKIPAERSNCTVRVRFIKYWLPVILYAIIIFYFSSLPGKDIPALFDYQDVVFHVVEYAILAFLVNRAMKACYPELSYKKRFVLVLFFCVLYAISDEFHQSFVPNRNPSILDATYDGMGICIANILSHRNFPALGGIPKKRNNKSHSKEISAFGRNSDSASGGTS